MDKSFSKSFFLISFLPAIAYWYLDEYYPVRIAITGGLALAILEISAEKIFIKHVHTISKANFFLILFLGGLSLLGDEGVWFRLQPAITGVGISSFMFYRLKIGKGLLEEFLGGLPLKSKPPSTLIVALGSNRRVTPSVMLKVVFFSIYVTPFTRYTPLVSVRFSLTCFGKVF